MLSSPTDIDLFDLWRRMLGVVCGIYVALRSAQSLQRLYELLWGQSGRLTVLARRYVLVQLLRTRLRKFACDLIEIVALALLFAGLLFAHKWV